jgi:hypothetical protein
VRTSVLSLPDGTTLMAFMDVNTDVTIGWFPPTRVFVPTKPLESRLLFLSKAVACGAPLWDLVTRKYASLY